MDRRGSEFENLLDGRVEVIGVRRWILRVEVIGLYRKLGGLRCVSERVDLDERDRCLGLRRLVDRVGLGELLWALDLDESELDLMLRVSRRLGGLVDLRYLGKEHRVEFIHKGIDRFGLFVVAVLVLSELDGILGGLELRRPGRVPADDRLLGCGPFH